VSNPPRSPDVLLRLAGYLKPYKPALALVMFFLAGVAVTEGLLPALLRPLIDRGFSGHRPDYVWIAPLSIIAIFLVRGVLTFSSSYLLSWISNRVLSDMRQTMFDTLLRLPNRYFKRTPSSLTLNRFIVDANNALALAAEVFTTAVRDSLVVVGLLGWMLYLNWRLTLIAMVVIPVATWVTRMFGSRLRVISRGTQEMNVELTRIVMEGIDGQRVIKLYDGYDYEQTRFETVNQRLRRFAMRNTVAAAATVPVTHLLASVGLAIVVAIALSQSGQHDLSVGGFASFVSAMLMLLAPLKALANLNGPLQRMRVAADSVFAFLGESREMDAGTRSIERARGLVEFRGVGFRYSDADTETLKEVDLVVQPGETVAFVGRSGSGKTTLMNLVPRFINPSSGAILLDGIDLRDLKLASLRRQIAHVSQDVMLFDDTIAANVAYGADRKSTPEAIRQALAAANLLEFVDSLPQRELTLVGENATRLSGGQRQRLAIARALIKDAPILVLDEATSALDNESERQVQESIERLMKGRTTLVIAHRFTTIQNADRIVVLDQGRIVEMGRHDQLLAQGGLYASLYRMQFAELGDTTQPALS
jgi:subfamily B ATP-binding cassette protein MsbA